MLNFIVETKQEYTTQLVNVLTPLIFEGIESIYQEALHSSSPDNTLKNFQLFLKKIPKWNNDMIKRETERIMNNSKSYSWLEDLIRATLKSNIIVLTYNPSVKSQTKIDPLFYKNIDINDFIHKIYIECARDLWNNPYLFYHNFPPIELKRNQRDAIYTIKECIKEAIRKLLPVKHILNIYLGEEIEYGSPDDNFEKSISEVEGKNLSKLIKLDLQNQDNKLDHKLDEKLDHKLDDKLSEKLSDKFSEKLSEKLSEKFEGMLDDNSDVKTSDNYIPKLEYKPIIDEKEKNDSSDNNTVGSRILNILNNKDLKLTDNVTSSDNFVQLNSNIDNKIKKILENDLGESETSISNNLNDKYHEVFSNSVVNQNNSVNDTSSMNLTNNKNKTKFFANYLQF
jgi:hypothetical protein